MHKQVNISAIDGAEIFAELFALKQQPQKGAVIIVHGFGEHTGGYHETAEKFSQAGYASIVFNQRGHGMHAADKKSAKKQGIIPKYQAFLDDISSVAAYMKNEYPNLPVSLYGHSMGGNIVINYLFSNNTGDYKCAVLESPWLGLYREKGFLVNWLAIFLGFISPNIAIINKLNIDDITSDIIKANIMKNDPLYHNRISMRLFASIVKRGKYAEKNGAKITIPLYLAYAKNERIVCNRAINKFAGGGGANIKKYEYESNHAIHNDKIRETFFNDVIKFLDNCRLGAKND